MEEKGFSLNLVLKKRGSPHAFQSVSEIVSEDPFSEDQNETKTQSTQRLYHIPPDTSEKVLPSRKEDVLTPWGWYSHLSEEDKCRWERQKAQGYTPPDTSETVPSLDRDVSRGFLERHGAPPVVLEVFPDWQGILVRSSVLDMSLWLVRSRRDGEDLARETGHPAILLDDVLSQKGRTREEAREALLSVLICPGNVQ